MYIIINNYVTLGHAFCKHNNYKLNVFLYMQC